MAAIPHDWAIYAHCQQQLANRSSLDDTSWGLESGLDTILGNKAQGESEVGFQVTRTISNASRRNRYGAMLLRKYSADITDGDEVSVICEYEARSDLARLTFGLSSQNYRLLILVGHGADRANLCQQFHINPMALRARIARARTEARKLLAT